MLLAVSGFRLKISEKGEQQALNPKSLNPKALNPKPLKRAVSCVREVRQTQTVGSFFGRYSSKP